MRELWRRGSTFLPIAGDEIRHDASEFCGDNHGCSKPDAITE